MFMLQVLEVSCLITLQMEEVTRYAKKIQYEELIIFTDRAGI